MQKIIITLVTFFVAMQLGAATYTILSQNNDTIRLYSNELGESLKSLITKADSKPQERYRLIEKNDEGYFIDKSSLLAIVECFIFAIFSSSERYFLKFSTD